MKNAHYRDSATLIEFAYILEKGIENGEGWTELKVAKELNKLRSQQKGSIHKLHNRSHGERWGLSICNIEIFSIS